MRILILNYEFPPLGGGGGRISADIGARLTTRGHEVAVLTSHLVGLPRREQRDGMTLLRVRCGRRRADRCTVPEMGGFTIASLLPTLGLARRWRPDVMHVHFAVPTGPTGWLASTALGIPYVLTAHLGDVPGGVPSQTDHLFRFIKPLTVPIWRRASVVTAVSPFVAKLCHRAYGVDARVIYNGIDLSGYPRRRKAPSEPPRMIWVGRMQPQKNLPAGLRQLADLSDLEWTLDVVGDGEDRGAAERAVRETGLSGRVRFRGWITEESVRAALAQADILYLPSHSEGLSVAALQALASGLVIVGSRIGGLNDLVEDGVNGFLCPLDEKGAFAQALGRLVGDRALLETMQRESLRIAQRFSAERMVDHYESALEDAVATAGRQ